MSVNPIDSELKVIEDGFKPGNQLVWNGRQLTCLSKKEAKAQAAKLTVATISLEKVSDCVVKFFKTHPNASPEKTLANLKKRVAPYKGLYGWWLWLTFRGGACRRVIQSYTKMIEGVYEVRYIQDLAPISKTGIRLGIQNLGSSCWFNSALKFLATTTLFDDAINRGESRLHNIFKRTINELRMGNGGEILSPKVLAQLQYECSQEFPQFSFYEQQHSDEFFRLLLEKLNPNIGKNLSSLEDVERLGLTPFYYECFNRYVLQEEGDATKKTASDNFKGEMVLDVDMSAEGSIDLNSCLTQMNEVEVRADSDHKNHQFSKGLVATHLPDHLFVNVKRIQMGEHGTQKCSRPIELKDNCIKFEQYKVEGDHVEVVGDVVYQIDAAIIHLGGTKGGHYVCATRNPDGSMVVHNDRLIYPAGDRLLAQGLFFRLSKVI